MAETTNDDLRAMIQESIIANKAMHESTATRMSIDARANSDQIASMKAELSGRVQAVATGLTTLEQRILTVEGKADGADTAARAAMKSHDDLQVYFRNEIGDVKTILHGQNDAAVKAAEVAKAEAEERERIKKEERDRQSIAAKALEADRQHKEKMTAARTPQIVAALGLLGIIGSGLVSYYSARAAHSDLNAKADTQTTQLASVQKKLEVVAQAVASVEPAVTVVAPSSTSLSVAAAPPATASSAAATVYQLRVVPAAPAAAPRAVGAPR